MSQFIQLECEDEEERQYRLLPEADQALLHNELSDNSQSRVFGTVSSDESEDDLDHYESDFVTDEESDISVDGSLYQPKSCLGLPPKIQKYLAKTSFIGKISNYLDGISTSDMPPKKGKAFTKLVENEERGLQKPLESAEMDDLMERQLTERRIAKKDPKKQAALHRIQMERAGGKQPVLKKIKGWFFFYYRINLYFFILILKKYNSIISYSV